MINVRKKDICVLTGSKLKIIACISMLIDHAAILLMMTAGAKGVYDITGIYEALRIIGRIAFPLCCFLLVEGFAYSKNIMRYTLSMGFVALISEPVYQLYFNEDFRMMELIDVTRNVCITFTLGLIMMSALKNAESKINGPFARWLTYLLVVVIFCLAVHALKVDYDIGGIILIATLYLLREKKHIRLIAGYLVVVYFYTGGLYSFPAFVLMSIYNGKRGMIYGKIKYIFYIFYPIHLLMLYIIRECML